MRDFLRRVLLYGLAAIVIAMLSRAITGYAFRFHLPSWTSTTRVLVVGDSHIRMALDAALLESARSVALDAEPYMVTYFKLRHLLDAMPRASVVILGFGPHNLAPFNDAKFVQPAFAVEMARRYYGILPWRDLDDVPVSTSIFAKVHLQHFYTPDPHLLGDLLAGWTGHQRDAHPYLGSTPPEDGTWLTDERLAAVIGRHFDTTSGYAVSVIQEAYLHRMVRLLTERGVSLLLVGTPTHPLYRGAIPAALATRHRILCHELDLLPNVRCADFSSLITDERHFFDFDHVNRQGSRVLTLATAAELRALVGPPDP